MRKRYSNGSSLFLMIIILLLSQLAVGCSNQEKPLSSLGGKGSSAKAFKVGIALRMPGQGDGGFNDAIVKGVKKAEEELAIDYTILNPKDLLNDEESLNYLAANEYDLVIVAGPTFEKALNTIAPQYKDIKFAILNGSVDQPNVTSIMFKEEEAGFFAGIAAASLSKTGVVGFIGGAKAEKDAQQLQNGFLKGVQFINNQNENKQIRTYISYAGFFADGLYKPEKGKELALTQYFNGADIIFQIAGQTGNGVYMAAKEAKKFVIGNDPKQAELAPWNNYGIAVKKIDSAVLSIIKDGYEQKLKPGLEIYGIVNDAIDFIPGEIVPREVRDRIKAIKASLKQGNIDLEKIKPALDIEVKLPEPTKDGQDNN